MADRLHLPIRYRTEIEILVRRHAPDVEVWAYGSRVDGRSHAASDLDLALRAPDLQPIPRRRLSALREALRESSVPILVEVHDWSLLPASSHPHLERSHVVLVPPAEPEPTTVEKP